MITTPTADTKPRVSPSDVNQNLMRNDNLSIKYAENQALMQNIPNQIPLVFMLDKLTMFPMSGTVVPVTHTH